MTCRVIKLGGSLLDWSELTRVLRTWLARQTAMTNVLIVGGGDLVDVVRGWDEVYCLASEKTHWLAIGALGVTARLLADLLPEAKLIRELSDLDRGQCAPLQILDIFEFMRTDCQSINPLPHTWEVTSDSIAARVADQLNAVELVLLKSEMPRSADASAARLNDLAADGYVDSYLPACFPTRSALRCVNLRSADSTS